jgi:hypothetical protein
LTILNLKGELCDLFNFCMSMFKFCITKNMLVEDVEVSLSST